MRPAAELSREAVDLDDTDFLAVFLTEQHHRSELACLGDRRHERPHRDRLEDLLVDNALDTLALLRRERLCMAEVEAELVGTHGRARLFDVIAKHFAEGRVQQVSRSVVRHRRKPHAPRHDGPNAVTGGEA